MTAAATAAYGVSWFMPTLKGGGDPSVARLDNLLGWQAFQFVIVGTFEALQRTAAFGERALQLLALVSALTNIAFIAAASSWLRRGTTECRSRALTRAVGL